MSQISKKEILKDADLMRLALQSLRLEYVVDAFDKAIPYVGNNFEQFKIDYETKIMELHHVEGDERLAAALGTHTLERTIGNTMAIANIILVSTYLDQVSQISGLRTNQLCVFGPKINNKITWARGIRAASNYVRHMCEWQVPTKKLRKGLEGIVLEPVSNLLELLKRADSKENVRTILGLGFSEAEILETGSNVAYRIADKLALTNVSQTKKNFSLWVKDVDSNLT